ncbi:MAG: hypothetical protein ACJAYJ_002265 [Saprospiraceae bacterium]|jgi:hypothetical protein
MDVLEQQMLDDPKRSDKIKAIEKHTEDYIAFPNKAVNGIISIPVVFHVVYRTATENISDAQIASQMQVLNDDFRRLNSDADGTWSQADDIEIGFCMATVDPNGNATTGVTRTSTSVNGFGTNDAVKSTSSGGVNAWPAGDYLNIWVCNIGGGILGYAQFPGGNPATDGVVNGYQYTGTIGTASAPFDLGRTLTHEVGHYLNLRHIWGDGNCNADDFVTDTPTSDAANYGCASGHVSCNSTDMVQNYMDYSDDACMNLFTAGQKSRMRAIFDTGGARESLLASGACGTAPPAATCTDNIQNGTETGVDCGGSNCAPCPCTGTFVNVSITLDNYPEETSWSLTNASGAVVASGGTYASQPDGSTVAIETCLPDGCYDFQINDAYGDGICCSYGNGSYAVTGGGNTLASGGSFTTAETTNFCLGGGGEPTATCDDNLQNGDETGVDCGGTNCPACPTCNDGILNGNETGVDCGGSDCSACPTCNDGIQNGSETGVDCGGTDCAPCNTGGCQTVNIDSNNFDSGWGIWNDGGSDCRRSANDAAYANSGSRCVRLRDNTSSSVMTTDNLNLAGFEEVTVDFSYIGVSMENGEDFWLQVSLNGGSSYQTLITYARGTDFANNVRENESVLVTGTFASSTRFRFRCDASANGDRVYIDDVVLTGCANGNREEQGTTPELEVETTQAEVARVIQTGISNVNLFPNPTTDKLNIAYQIGETAEVFMTVVDLSGKIILRQQTQVEAGAQQVALTVSNLNAGIYLLQIVTKDSRVMKKFVIAN